MQHHNMYVPCKWNAVGQSSGAQILLIDLEYRNPVTICLQTIEKYFPMLSQTLEL